MERKRRRERVGGRGEEEKEGGRERQSTDLSEENGSQSL